jgi:hypothetical protein
VAAYLERKMKGCKLATLLENQSRTQGKWVTLQKNLIQRTSCRIANVCLGASDLARRRLRVAPDHWGCRASTARGHRARPDSYEPVCHRSNVKSQLSPRVSSACPVALVAYSSQ